jgi:hypothetical protein
MPYFVTGRLNMFAEYNGLVYLASVYKDKVILMTYDPEKASGGFVPKRDYYTQTVRMDDSSLGAVYELHFWVRYADNIEDNNLWLVDEERSVGLKADIKSGQVVIDVPHDAKNDSWTQYEKGAAVKVINLSDCGEYIVEKCYIRRNREIINMSVKTFVSPADFRRAMLLVRKENL